MEIYSVVVYVVICILAWSLLERLNGKRNGIPPSPMKLPILGNIHNLLYHAIDSEKIIEALNAVKNFSSIMGLSFKKPMYLSFHELSLRHGPIMNIKLGMTNGVIISNAALAKEAFSSDNMANRLCDWTVDRSYGRPLGLIFNNGKGYKDIKSFTVRTLREFGFGKMQSMELAIEEELKDFVDHLDKTLIECNGILNMHHVFTLPVLNVLWGMMTGKRFAYTDAKLHALINEISELSRAFDIGGSILMAFPFLRYITPQLTGHSSYVETWTKLQDIFENMIKERLNESATDKSDDESFLDAYISEIKAKKNDAGNVVTAENFIILCADLFAAGSETTANTLNFAILYLVLNPMVQQRIHKEIDETIGQEKMPEISDRARLPFVEATILETQRFCNVIPLVHRVCTKNMKIGGYAVKKDDVVLVNMYSLQRDHNIYNVPNSFDPARFLDQDGKLLKVSDALIPFGFGKRVCLGERLARHTLFVFFTRMMQKYEFKLSQEHGCPRLEYEKGFTLSPRQYYVRVIQRKPTNSSLSSK